MAARSLEKSLELIDAEERSTQIDRAEILSSFPAQFSWLLTTR